MSSRRWFAAYASEGWATCPVTESGFVRVSSNRHVLPAPVSVTDALAVLALLRARPGHRFLTDNVSMVDPDVPSLTSHRQVTDAHLLALARRHEMALVTFDAGMRTLASTSGAVVELLTTL